MTQRVLWINPLGTDVFDEPIRAKLEMEIGGTEALAWATTRGSRSGRTAYQYIQDLAGRLGKTLG